MSKITKVVPRAEKYLDASFNVLLIGLHGTGKTTAVMDLAAAKGMKVKLFTCSTLDVYTDLVGVPETVVGPDGQKSLEMVRPREVDHADFIFFDEINRADPKTLNAILEIVQFGTINGERLPNLKCCWAAMNPPGMDYQVEDLDPALVDRFDVFEEVKARPSVAYMSQHMRPAIAKALVKWWEGMDKDRRTETDYISPRRLLKLGLVYEQLGSCDPALPAWVTVERTKLADLLRDAENAAKGQAAASAQGGVGAAPDNRITYEKAWIEDHNLAVASILSGSQDDLATHNAVVEAVRSVHAPRLVRDFSEVMTALRPSVLEAFVTSLADGKASRLHDELAALPEDKRAKITNLTSVVEADHKARLANA